MDILFLAHNRRLFTELALYNLLANTDWSQVETLYLYDDRSSDGAREVLAGFEAPCPIVRRFGAWGGPVDVMNHYLQGSTAEVFAKIDSDTMVPPGWDEECSRVMAKHPELDLLGIEVFRPVKPGQAERSYDRAEFIGGIGLMRKRCFQTLPTADGRFGFTAWQQANPVVPGWLNPAIPVFLLDHLPMEPYASLSFEYERNGWQRRQWGKYDPEKQGHLWEWWEP